MEPGLENQRLGAWPFFRLGHSSEWPRPPSLRPASPPCAPISILYHVWAGEGRGGAGRGWVAKQRGPPAHPGSSQTGLKGSGFGAPAPTFLHQFSVGMRAAHDQQHGQEHKGQDDAHHGARAQACGVWVMAWGRQRCQGCPAGGIGTVGSGRSCQPIGDPHHLYPLRPCSLVIHQLVQKAVISSRLPSNSVTFICPPSISQQFIIQLSFATLGINYLTFYPLPVACK